MKILFFIVHPAKFWMFRNVTNHLIEKGHDVEWLIVSKDMLEELVKSEGWKYTNIFPEGRRIKGIPILLATVINMFKTVFRLFKHTWGKKYDLFITSDMLSFVGWIKRIPSLVFQDDDFSVVPEYAPIWFFASKVVTPATCDLGPLNYKRLKYKGSHKWSYCDTRYFKPDRKVIETFNPKLKKYSIIRLVSMSASHDRGKKGVDNKVAQKLIDLLGKYGRVYINAERPLPKKWEKYRIKLDPKKMHHAMYYAQIFVGDSQSMISEAGLMGTPAIRFNDFAGRIGYLNEEENQYGLNFSFNTSQGKRMLNKVEDIMNMENAKKEWKKRVDRYSKEHIDTTAYYIKLIESYDPKRKIKK